MKDDYVSIQIPKALQDLGSEYNIPLNSPYGKSYKTTPGDKPDEPSYNPLAKTQGEFKATMLFENMVGEHPEDVTPVLLQLCVVSDTAHGALRKAADFIETRGGTGLKRVDVVEVPVSDKSSVDHKPVMVVTDLSRGLPAPRHGLLPQHLSEPMFPGIGSFYRECISDDAPTVDFIDLKGSLKAVESLKDVWLRPGGLVEWLLSPKCSAMKFDKPNQFANAHPASLPTVFAEGPLPKAMGLGHFRITRSNGGMGWTDPEKAKKN
jgi:hypothetical protein